MPAALTIGRFDRFFVAALIGAVVGAVVGAATMLWAQPELRTDGFLTGWSVVTSKGIVCYNPYVTTKERTIRCG